MKRGMAILGSILLVIGLGLSWTGRALGGETRATVRLFGRSWEVTAPGAVHSGWHTSTAAAHEPQSTLMPGGAEIIGFSGSFIETDPFFSISLDVDLGSVTIAAGDSYLVDVSYWGNNYVVRWANDGDTLLIWSESDGLVTGTNCGSDITIYVPADMKLEYISAQLDLGSITLAGLIVDWANLDLNLGDVIGEELTVCSYLCVDADLGAVTLYGDLNGSVEIDADLGDVTLGLSQPADHYCWDLNAALGSVTVDGRHYGGISSSDTGGSGDTILQVDADLGSIQVDFNFSQAAAAYYFKDAVIAEGGSATDYGWTYTPAVPDPPSVPSAPEAPKPPSVPAAPTPTVNQAG